MMTANHEPGTIDQHIREAMSDDEQSFLKSLDDTQPLLHEVLNMFRGRRRAVMIATTVFGIVFLGLTILCVVQMFNCAPDDLRSLLLWMSGFIYSLVLILGMKIWSWMEMQTNSVRREIKRLELGLTALGARLDEKISSRP
ncbi:MAG: DUF6768 family protein [Planctomycetota bacterium]